MLIFALLGESIMFRVLVQLLSGFSLSLLYARWRTGKKLRRQVYELGERKRMLDRTIKHVHSKDNLLKEVTWVHSHQLRGPLSTVLGLTDLLKQYDTLDTGKCKQTSIAQRSGRGGA